MAIPQTKSTSALDFLNEGLSGKEIAASGALESSQEPTAVQEQSAEPLPSTIANPDTLPASQPLADAANPLVEQGAAQPPMADESSAQAVVPQKPEEPSLIPSTKQALKDLWESAAIGPLREAEKRREQEYRQRNEIPGVPLDLDTGASAWEKFVLSFRREKENQIAYLQNKYGEGNVRQDENGDLIVRVLDESNGKPKDLKIDERNMSAKDLVSLAGSFPEIAGGIIAIMKGRQVPKLDKLKGILGLQRDIAASALGGEAAGAAKDVGIGLYDKGSADLPGIARERATMALGDVLIGEGTLGAGRFFKYLQNPAAGYRGKVQFDALDAQKYFREKYGIDVPLSIGESTGAPIIARTEAFMEKLPGGGTPFQELKTKQESALRRLQNIMMGKLPETDEKVGRQMVDELTSKVVPQQQAVTQATKTVGRVGNRQINSIISNSTMPEHAMFRSEVGKSIRDAVVAKRDLAKAEADALYDAVRKAPGGSGSVFDAAGLQSEFKSILDKLPSPEQTVTVPSPILGPTGKPIMVTSTEKEVLREFVPPNVLARLKSVAELGPDAKFSLSDLQQMRREVYDDIAKGEGVPGLGTHYLADIGKSLTKAIEDGVNSLPTGDLKNALMQANKAYKEKVIPFNRAGITELFREASEPGFVTDSEVVSRIFDGGKSLHRYNLLKETLGPKSTEFTLLKRAVADRLLENSRYPGEKLVDPSRFITNLQLLQTQSPEIANDVFGNKLAPLFREAKLLEYAMKYAENPKVDASKLATLISSKSPTAAAFKNLIYEQKRLDEMYSNRILKAVADGTLDGRPPNPVEFVNRFIDNATPSELQKAMYLIRGKPELVEDIRAKTVEKLFRDASRKATPADIGKLLAGDPTRIVSGTSVYKQIENPTIQQKMRAVLGPEVYKDLAEYIKLEAAGEFSENSFKSAGGLAAGMQIATLTRRGPLQYMWEAGKDWMVASLLTRQPLRGWLTSVPSKEAPGVLSLILTSPQFLQAVAKEFPGSTGESFVTQIKDSVDRYVKSLPQDQQQQMKQPAKKKTAFEMLSEP